MDNIELVQWQKRDPDNGLIQPWFTHDSLDFIKKLSLFDKDILQYGAGLGDAWLAQRSKRLISIERTQEWGARAAQVAAGVSGIDYQIIYRPCNDCDGKADYYCEFPDEMKEPDVIIIDDAYRFECILKAIEYSKTTTKESILLIVDNWVQSFVFMCPAAEEALAPYPAFIFEQKDHTDNDGVNKWKTGVWQLIKL